jgi:hypothetical protein
LALADHNREAWAAIKALNTALGQVVFYLVPTVLQELCAHLHSKNFERQRLAKEAFSKLNSRAWQNFAACDFVPVGHGIVEAIGRELRHKGLLPDNEVNDSLIMGEVSLRECQFFLTEDGHFLKMQAAKLHVLIHGFDLEAPTILSCKAAVQLQQSGGH